MDDASLGNQRGFFDCIGLGCQKGNFSKNTLSHNKVHGHVG